MYGQNGVYTGSYTLHSIAVACGSKLKDKKILQNLRSTSNVVFVCANQLYDNHNWKYHRPILKFC